LASKPISCLEADLLSAYQIARNQRTGLVSVSPEWRALRVSSVPSARRRHLSFLTMVTENATVSFRAHSRLDSRCRAKAPDTFERRACRVWQRRPPQMFKPCLRLHVALGLSRTRRQPHILPASPLLCWRSAVSDVRIWGRPSRRRRRNCRSAHWARTPSSRRSNGSVPSLRRSATARCATLLTFIDMTASVNVELAIDRTGNQSAIGVEKTRNDFRPPCFIRIRSPLTKYHRFIPAFRRSRTAPQRKHARVCGLCYEIPHPALLALIDEYSRSRPRSRGCMELALG